MKGPIKAWLNISWRFLSSWQLPAALGALLLLGVAIWAWPQRSDWLVSADGQGEWQVAQASATRQILWEPPARLEELLPQQEGKGSFISPRFADNGATLYFSFRPQGGQADIYRSRFAGGKWQPAEPVAELNSAADDIGAVVTRDGRELFFYSNRPGGQGGTDIYVSRLTGDRWGPPKNLGAQVNSPAQEYDPALGPDGLTLFFSSNRTREMLKQARAPSTDAEPWSTTLRGHPGLPQFDLYLARRDGPDAAWTAPVALADLNLPHANEGAPFVSRSGNFLYFASDRPSRPGEPANLDLYRARWTGDRFIDVENLGPGINTAAHETEPALSPEGFTLVFASDRDKSHALYRSTAQEVFAQTRWDTSRLQALSSVWWKILLITFLLSALVILTAYARGWLMAKASAARFLLASVMLHALVLLLLSTVPLVNEIAERVVEIQTEMMAQSFQGVMGESQAPFESVADVGAPSPAAVPQFGRATPDMPLPPAPAAAPAPDMPIPLNKLFPKQVTHDTPLPPEDRTVDLARKQAAPPVVEVNSPAPEPLPEAVKPREQPLPAATAMLDRRPAAVIPQVKLETPLAPSNDPLRAAPAAIGVIKQKAAEPSLALDSAAVMPERRQARSVPQVVEELPKVDAAPAFTGGVPILDPVATPIMIGRKETNKTLDKALVLAPAKIATVFSPGGVIPQARASSEVGDAQPVANPLARSRSTARPVLVENLVPAEPAVASAPGTSRASAEKSPTRAEPVLPRLKTTASGAVSAGLKPADPVPFAGDVRPALPGKIGGSPSSSAGLPGLESVQITLKRRTAGGTQVAQAKNLAQVVYSLRDVEKRKQAIQKLGGSAGSEAAVERGLDWLAAHQHADGRWSLNQFHVNCKHPQCAGAATIQTDAAGTGLALLPFLGAGYTHKTGKHQANVTRALGWLLKNQRPDGALGAVGEYRLMYGHGIAAIALCEAYGMTRDPALREPAQRAIDFIVKAQHAPSGGWRYLPNTPGDTSVLGWQVMALKSGEMAGLSVPAGTWEGVRRWLASVESKTPTGGLFGYMGATPTPAMTAQGLLCLQLMGARRDDPRVLSGANYLLQNPPRQGLHTSYYWYHAVQVMYALGDKHWKVWNEPLRDMLVASQVATGPLAGSWNPSDAREQTGGRICSTALRLLMLEVYYRRLPLYRQLEH